MSKHPTPEHLMLMQAAAAVRDTLRAMATSKASISPAALLDCASRLTLALKGRKRVEQRHE